MKWPEYQSGVVGPGRTMSICKDLTRETLMGTRLIGFGEFAGPLTGVGLAETPGFRVRGAIGIAVFRAPGGAALIEFAIVV